MTAQGASRVSRASARVRWLAGLAGLVACASGPADDAARITRPPSRPGESTAQSLHRHGVNCMDELARRDCAVKYFEDLLALDPPERELVGDAAVRLVRLYRAEQTPEKIAPMLRGWWELGMAKTRAAKIPYGLRFVDPTVSIVSRVDLAALQRARLWRRLDEETRDTIFGCDEAAKPRSEAGRQRPERGPRRAGQRRQAGPTLAEEGLCVLAALLDTRDPRDWQSMVIASSHVGPHQSLIVARVDGLEERLERAVQAGQLVRRGDRAFELTGWSFQGAPVQLLTLDLDEAMLVPAPLAEPIVTARLAQRERLDPALEAQIAAIPADAVYYTALTQAAMQAAFADFGALGALLPTPEGMSIAAAVHLDAAVFVRMPTKDPLKLKLLVSVLRRVLDARAVADDADDATIVDVSASSDGKALVMVLVLGHEDVARRFRRSEPE